MKIRFEEGENYHISYDAKVKVTSYVDGKTKVTHVKTKNNNLAKYRRQNGQIINKVTGEIIEYEVPKFKTDKNIKRAIKETVKPLLENNFRGGSNELFVTLTFKSEMDDFNELTKYFNKFWCRLKYKYKNLDLCCLVVKEMQQTRRSWHLHLILKEQNNKYLYIPNNEMEKIWKYGITKVSRIYREERYRANEIDEESAMDSKTLFNVEDKFHIDKVIDYMCKLKTKSGEIPSSGRLHIQKGKLKLPKVERMNYGDVNNVILKDATFIREDTLLVKNIDTDSILNCIHTEEWQLNTGDVKEDDTS